MTDNTENIRKRLVGVINQNPSEREIMELKYGRVWTTDELTSEFQVEGFMAPFIVAIRKSDHVKGSLMFQDSPRFYFNWQEA